MYPGKRTAALAGLILLLLGVSCRQGGLVPLSELMVERLERNRFPLEAVSRGGDRGENTLLYRFRSENCLCTSEPELLCPEGWAVTMNGMEVPPFGKAVDGEQPHLIGGIVKEGENSIELRGKGSPGPVYLSGEFGVFHSDELGWYADGAKVLGTGPLAAQGLPFYPGSVSYVRRYEAPARPGKHILEIPHWEGSACELWVNREKVADITPGQNVRMDVGPFLEEGPNDVELRIRGTEAYGLYEDFKIL